MKNRNLLITFLFLTFMPVCAQAMDGISYFFYMLDIRRTSYLAEALFKGILELIEQGIFVIISINAGVLTINCPETQKLRNEHFSEYVAMGDGAGKYKYQQELVDIIKRDLFKISLNANCGFKSLVGTEFHSETQFQKLKIGDVALIMDLYEDETAHKEIISDQNEEQYRAPYQQVRELIIGPGFGQGGHTFKRGQTVWIIHDGFRLNGTITDLTADGFVKINDEYATRKTENTYFPISWVKWDPEE